MEISGVFISAVFAVLAFAGANEKPGGGYWVGGFAYPAFKAGGHFYCKPHPMLPSPQSLALGNRIRTLREAILIEWNGEKKPMTQLQLAERSGCDECTIWRAEHGVQLPNILLAKRIAKVLGLTLDELMQGIN